MNGLPASRCAWSSQWSRIRAGDDRAKKGLLESLAYEGITQVAGRETTSEPDFGFRPNAGQRMATPLGREVFVQTAVAHPALHDTNTNTLVDGPTLQLAATHSKVRRDGYFKQLP